MQGPINNGSCVFIIVCTSLYCVLSGNSQFSVSLWKFLLRFILIIQISVKSFHFRDPPPLPNFQKPPMGGGGGGGGYRRNTLLLKSQSEILYQNKQHVYQQLMLKCWFYFIRSVLNGQVKETMDKPQDGNNNTTMETSVQKREAIHRQHRIKQTGVQNREDIHRRHHIKQTGVQKREAIYRQHHIKQTRVQNREAIHRQHHIKQTGVQNREAIHRQHHIKQTGVQNREAIHRQHHIKQTGVQNREAIHRQHHIKQTGVQNRERERPSAGNIAGWWQHQAEDNGNIIVSKHYEKYLAWQILCENECWQNNLVQQVSDLQTFLMFFQHSQWFAMHGGVKPLISGHPSDNIQVYT